MGPRHQHDNLLCLCHSILKRGVLRNGGVFSYSTGSNPLHHSNGHSVVDASVGDGDGDGYGVGTMCVVVPAVIVLYHDTSRQIAREGNAPWL